MSFLTCIREWRLAQAASRRAEPIRNHLPPYWRVGKHYDVHVYQGDKPVASFNRPEDARLAVEAVNRMKARASHSGFKEGVQAAANFIRSWASPMDLLHQKGEQQRLREIADHVEAMEPDEHHFTTSPKTRP